MPASPNSLMSASQCHRLAASTPDRRALELKHTSQSVDCYLVKEGDDKSQAAFSVGRLKVTKFDRCLRRALTFC